MAEFLWTFAVQEVLKKIVTYGAEQIGVVWGMKKELSHLKRELHQAETILAGINKKKLHDESVKQWVEKLQDIIYEADDLLDELVYEDLRRTAEQTGILKKVRDSISLSKNPFLFRCKKANRMKDITQTLNKHYLTASLLGLVGDKSVMEGEAALTQIRETISNLDLEVIGREAEVSEIIKLVIKSSNQHDVSVISIVGMGGLGKTTLAKMVFNHDVIKKQFDKRIWVCVSKPFIVMKILEGIYQGLTKTSSGVNSKEVLLEKLQKEIQDKRYFLVLDDVWDIENGLWEELSGCLKLIAKKSGNSIMVTTRVVEVATTAKTVSIHHLNKLDDDQCWSLFKKSANADQLPKNPKLKNMKNELVRKMGGVPLVAKVLGGAAKFEEGDYENWISKVKSIARNISIGDIDFISSILKLSVDSLPNPVLKQCFAYCSNFPQDYVFQIDKIIQMWIAQGFIQPQLEKENLTMEDIGEKYFNFLLSRSLFQDVIRDKYKRIISFKLHDIMHDIACTMSNHQKMESNPNDLSGKNARKLRTLICDGQIYKTLNDFVCLRVLKLSSFYVRRIPMDKLIHLRYLDVSEYHLDDRHLDHRDLQSLSLLYNLQTLKFGYIRSELPKNLRKLVNLRHVEFETGFDMKRMPSRMGNLIHLQTLSKFIVGIEKGYKIEELGPLKNLKGELTLSNLSAVQTKEEAMGAKLKEKRNLRHLVFQWLFKEDNQIQVLEGLEPHKNLQSLEIMWFAGIVLPNCIFVENLVKIYLNSCSCEELPMLGQLRCLEKLRIENMNRVRSIENEFYGIESNQTNSFAFPQLKKLCIDGMENLRQWDETTIIASNLFGCLKKLRIYYCDQLVKLPNGLEGCLSIEYLRIHVCRKLTLNVQNLHNLYSLDICEFKSLPEGLGELTNLKELIIRGEIQNYEFSAFIYLSSQLDLLELNDSSTTTQLPQQLQHLTNLKVLRIGHFDFEVLPEWLGNLTCLKTLEFIFCYNLKELPSREAILRLTKLEELSVIGCSKLLDQERAKVSHLRSVHIY